MRDTKNARDKSINLKSSSKDAIEQTANIAIDSVLKVHRALGPGLLESAYQACLAHELTNRGQKVQTEIILPIQYENVTIDKGFRMDMVVNEHLLIENKSVSKLTDTHQAQVITYLKLSDLRLGLLVNWNTRLVRDGIKRIVMNL